MASAAAPPASDIVERARRVVADGWLGSDDGGLVHAQARLRAVVASTPARLAQPRGFAKLYFQQADFESDRRGLELAAQITAPSSTVQVPRILRTLAADRCLITEHVDGIPLRSPLRRRYLTLPPKLVMLTGELGEWLALFHAGERALVPRSHQVQERAELIFDLLGRVQPWLGAAAARSMADEVRRVAQALDRQALNIARCHGDFTLGNMLVADDRLYVIDFGSSGVGMPEVDVVAFFSSLRSAIGMLPFSGSAESRMRAAFLDGYRRRQAAPLSSEALALADLYVLVQQLAEPFDYPPPRPAKRLWETYVFVRNLLHLRAMAGRYRRE
jgi:tRNA A-37 threonylcarbamoyl transferase component Bud32